MGAVAAARRTQSAFPAYLVASHASDLQFQSYSPQSIASLAHLTKELEHLPQVTRVAIAPNFDVTPIGANGKALPNSVSSDEITTIGSVGGEYFTQDRVAVVAGRMANPKSTHEMVATAEMVKLAHWHLGETVKMGDFTVAQINRVNPATSEPALKFSAKLVGLVVFSDQVASDDIDSNANAAYQLLTPALTRRLQAGATYPGYGLRLRGGTSDVAAVEQEITRLVPKGTPYAFLVTSVTEGRVERSSKPEAIALGVFGAIAALAALLIAGQAISRGLWADRDDLDVLRALGADPLTLTWDAIFGLLGAVVLGAALAVLLAVGLSPLAPLGPARQVDPTPGFAFDWTVLGVGFAVMAVGLGALTVALAYRRARRHIGQRSVPVQRGSVVVNAAARYGLSAPAVAGLRFSLEAGHGRSAVPVRSVLVASALAVTVVVTTLTFASGLNTLVAHPALYGWNWSYAIEPQGGDSVPPVVGHLLDHDSEVAAWTGFNYGDAQIDGQTVPTLGGATHAALSPPILSGHGIEAKNQIVLGAATLAALHKEIGQSVVLSYGSPQDAPIYQPPTHLVIVGTATMPAIGTGGTLHPSMGTGALFSQAIFVPALARASTNADPNLNGPAIDVVRTRSGITPTAALSSLQRIADAANKVIANDPNPAAYGSSFVVLGVQRPAEIVNYQSTGASPGILAAGLAVGAVVALGLTLGASVRRRRRDIALLKALGFTRRQLAVAVAWQASVAAIVGIVVGVPVGIALGRWLWDLFARDIYAVPLPTVPVLEVVLVALGALVLANLVAAVPGQMAARTPTALVLRAE